jgi:hypothetical protein
MSKSAPDHEDARLVLQLYDLRREAVIRESRDAILRDFWPKSEDEALAVLQPEHPLNRAWRQTSTYWEMAYGMARHGIVHTDYLLENTGEGIFLFAKVEPYLGAMRAASHPGVLKNAEWIVGSGDVGRSVLERCRKRVGQWHENR